MEWLRNANTFSKFTVYSGYGYWCINIRNGNNFGCFSWNWNSQFFTGHPFHGLYNLALMVLFIVGLALA